jgi:hypothetical protein
MRPVSSPRFGAHSETHVPAPPKGHYGPSRRRDEPVPDGDLEQRAAPLAALDPLFCQLALHPSINQPAGELSGLQTASAALPFRGDLQNLINGLARRVAWGGDRRKGSARIELSEGPLAGATLIVHAEQRSVSVELELPPGASSAGDWPRRILGRLEERGFSAHVRVG